MHTSAPIGEDGDALRDLLRDEGVDVEWIEVVDGPSGHAVIQVDAQGRNAIIISGGANRCVAQPTSSAAIQAAQRAGPGKLALAAK